MRLKPFTRTRLSLVYSDDRQKKEEIMKTILTVKEAVYGFESYYVVKYTDGSSKIVHYLTKELEKHLEE